MKNYYLLIFENFYKYQKIKKSDPNYFLIYTTSVCTLVTFTKSKFNSLMDLYKTGLDNIKDYLLKEYTKKV